MVDQIQLDDQNYQRLVYLSEHAESVSIRRRSAVIKSYHEGMDTRAISEKVGLSAGRVRYWRREFVKKGMSIFPGIDNKNNELMNGNQPMKSETDGDDTEIDKINEPLNSQGFVSKIDHIKKTATQLFEATQQFHALDEKDLELLHAANDLHIIFNPDEQKFQQPLTRDYVSQRSQIEISDSELWILRAVIGFQRGKINRNVINRISPDPGKQQKILYMIALFRIACSLDASDSQSTEIQILETKNSIVRFSAEGPHSELDSEEAQTELEKIKETIRIPISFENIDKKDFRKAKKQQKFSFPEPMESPGIEPRDPMVEAGRKVLKFYFAEMLSHEEGTKLGNDIEELHDMRVATRRMRSAFSVFGDYFRKKSIRGHLNGLRAAGKSLGRVRDLDVFMEKADRYIQKVDANAAEGLAPLIDGWKTERDSERKKMLKYLNSSDYEKFKQEFNIFLNSPGMGAREPEKGDNFPKLVQHAAPMLIYTSLASVRTFDSVIQSATIEQLHALRIEFKKLRYTVEFFREVLGAESKAVISDIKTLQDHLGDLNDADVACQILSDFLANWEIRQMNLPLSERKNPEPVVEYLAAKHAERHVLMTTFPEAWNKFNRQEFRKNLALAISVL